jgi:hypothetical protein
MICGGAYVCAKECDEGDQHLSSGIQSGDMSKIEAGVNQMKTGVEVGCLGAQVGMLVLDVMGAASTAKPAASGAAQKIVDTKPTVGYNQTAGRFQTSVPANGSPGRPFVANTTGETAMNLAAKSAHSTGKAASATANAAKRAATDFADDVASEVIQR